MPLWRDVTGSISFIVLRNSEVLESLKHSDNFQSKCFLKTGNNRPSFSVDLEKKGYLEGETIEGSITLKNIADLKLRKIDIKLSCVEFAKAGRHKRSTIKHDYEINIPPNEITEGMAKKFNLPLPIKAISSYEGKYSNIRWIVEVGLDLPLRFDIKAKNQVEVLQ